jgi:hypothetical protein
MSMAVLFGPPFGDETAFSSAAKVFVGGDGPYERGKFARNGDIDDINGLSSPGEPAMPGAQPHLRLPGDVLDRLRQGFVAVEDLGPDPCWQAIGPAAPTAAIIDSQSVKAAEKWGPASIRMAMRRARRSKARNAISSSTRKAC